MIYVIFTACSLLTAPQNCEQHILQFYEPALTPFQCLMLAQTELAKWAVDHPTQIITKFRCTYKVGTEL